jgi:hypothetical protein
MDEEGIGGSEMRTYEFYELDLEAQTKALEYLRRI